MSLNGFQVLPLAFSSKSTSCHDIFIKEHSVRVKDDLKPAGQTLFLLNIPPYTSEVGLRNAFSNIGNIKRVIFESNAENESGDGFKRAFVVFNKREHLLKALKLKKLNPLSSDSKPIKLGLEKLKDDYNTSIVDIETLETEINTFMSEYDSNENKPKNEEIVDDEGWTVVTKGGRKPGLARKESLVNKLHEKTQKNTKKKELKNFYTFQIRESKMKNIATLRKNFEEAKNKVQIMKQARKFKPY